MEFTERISNLLYQYLQGSLTADGEDELQQWVNESEDNRRSFNNLNNKGKLQSELKTWYEIPTRGLDDDPILLKEVLLHEKRHDFSLYKWTAVAAAVVLTTLAVFYFYERHISLNSKGQPFIVNQNDVGPVGNKATLILASGKAIDLSGPQEGIVVNEGGITYSDGTNVNNEQSLGEDGGSNGEDYALLRTPNGGQYHVTLADGTKVWLNAASTLKYPIRFNGDKRVVELEGEAYFEVEKHSEKPGNGGRHKVFRPFMVKSKGQIAVVYGTEFNISTYPEEPEVKTTLVNGALTVIKDFIKGKEPRSVMLEPGEAVVASNAMLKKEKANLHAALAWRSGKFYFKDTPFVDVMQEIVRWYDIEVVYEGKVPQDLFTGEMSRNVNLLAVLDFLRGSDIQFKVEGKKLIIK